MADKRRLIELGMATELAKEVASQIEGGAGEAVAGVATVGTPNASDEATAITLANALKARLNELITALKS